jgi:hypothetical protein
LIDKEVTVHLSKERDTLMKHSAKHPGFKSVASKISKKEGVSPKAAGAILAASTRGASKAAHKSNPRLNRVKK